MICSLCKCIKRVLALSFRVKASLKNAYQGFEPGRHYVSSPEHSPFTSKAFFCMSSLTLNSASPPCACMDEAPDALSIRPSGNISPSPLTPVMTRLPRPPLPNCLWERWRQPPELLEDASPAHGADQISPSSALSPPPPLRHDESSEPSWPELGSAFLAVSHCCPHLYPSVYFRNIIMELQKSGNIQETFSLKYKSKIPNFLLWI